MEQLFLYLENLVNHVPLEIYASIGGLVEEVLAPIPSPLIMTSAGSFALSQGYGPFYVVYISALAGVGKTIGSILIYYVADKAEDIFSTRFGKFLGISHEKIENFGKKFGKGWKDDVLLVILRAVPVLPGTPVAVAAGLIKMNMRTYIQSTFIGVFIRSLIFGYIGYYGLSQVNEYFANAEGYVDILLVLSILIGTIFFVYKKKEKLQKIVMKALDR